MSSKVGYSIVADNNSLTEFVVWYSSGYVHRGAARVSLYAPLLPSLTVSNEQMATWHHCEFDIALGILSLSVCSLSGGSSCNCHVFFLLDVWLTILFRTMMGLVKT